MGGGTIDAAVLAYTSSPDQEIPDGDSSGIVSTINASGLSQITDVNVTLNLTGDAGFNGDIYAYLAHEATADIAILLNRTGKYEGNIVGTFGSGFANVTFDDEAANDIHNYEVTLGGSFVSGGSLTGTWQPDGRNVDPDLVTTASSRTSFLDTFDGIDGDGEWTLFVADLSEGGTLTLSDWSIEVSAVPEPEEYAALIGVVLLTFSTWRRRRIRVKPKLPFAGQCA